jgi:hypothetical protein
MPPIRILIRACFACLLLIVWSKPPIYCNHGIWKNQGLEAEKKDYPVKEPSFLIKDEYIPEEATPNQREQIPPAAGESFDASAWN